MGELEIDDLMFLTMGGDLPRSKLCWVSFLLRKIGGASLANSTIAWFLHIFSAWPFSWARGHIHIFFVPFAFSCKVLLGPKVILCGPLDVHGGL